VTRGRLKTKASRALILHAAALAAENLDTPERLLERRQERTFF
jgi:hypothetical protein